MTEAIIELTVRNGTGHPISRAYFEGTLSSPGRSIPWYKDNSTTRSPEGWKLEKKPPGACPEYVQRVGKGHCASMPCSLSRSSSSRPEGKTLFSTDDFTAADETRLSSLKAKYTQ